jgi:hypothetical protein
MCTYVRTSTSVWSALRSSLERFSLIVLNVLWILLVDDFDCVLDPVGLLGGFLDETE